MEKAGGRYPAAGAKIEPAIVQNFTIIENQPDQLKWMIYQHIDYIKRDAKQSVLIAVITSCVVVSRTRHLKSS